MTKTRTRIGGILLACAMLLSLLPVSALAAVTEVDDTETYWNDATQSFRIYDDYWADLVTEQPSGYVADAEGKTVTISTAEALVWWAKQVNNGTSFADYTVSLTADIDLSGHYWTPIDTATIQYNTSDDGKVSWTTVEPKQKLDGVTIDGGGYTVTGLATATGIRGPAQPSEPGDGQNCYYYSAFIGRNDGTLTIQNITFDRASIAMTEPAEGVATNGTSMCAVVTAINSGALTMKSVTVSNAKVLAMQKASALLGMPSGGSFTVEQCAVTGCEIEAYFQVAPICGYVGTAGYPLTVNGIKLENNTTTIVKQGGQWQYQTYLGAVYYGNPEYYGAGKFYIGASETAVLDNVGTATVDGSTYTGRALALVAEVNGYQYSTLSAAIAAAPEGGTVTLLADTAENSLPYVDKTMTLDLNGHVLTTDRLVSTGELIIQDTTADAQPAVSADYESVTYASGKIKVTGTAVYAANGGTVTLESGTIESSYLGAYAQGDITGAAEVASTFNVEGGYIIAQEFAATAQGKGAALNISGGVLVAKDNAVVAGNGTKTAQKDLGGTTINITGGTMIGHAVTSGYIACGVYHPQQGSLNITGGTIYADGGVGVLMRAGTASITGGTVIATGTDSGKVGDSRIIQNCYGIIYDEESNYPGMELTDKVTISGSTRVSADASSSALYVWAGDDAQQRIVVTGGTFSSNPSAYLADGLAAVDSGDPVYQFGVTTASETPAEVVTAPADVNVSDEIPEEAKDVADEFSQALTDETVGGNVQPGIGAALDSAASTVAQNNQVTTETVVEEGQTVLDALQNATGTYDIDADTVAIVIQPYLDIQITGATDDGTNKTVTLDITPKYITVATTADVGTDDIVLDAEDGAVNAVQVGEPQELSITKPVTVTLSLPNAFAADGESFYVKHIASNGRTYYYTGSVESSILTFTNPHGFSEFTLLGATAQGMVAQLDGVGYTSLQDAVNDAADGDTITVLSDGLSASVTGADRTITLSNGTGSDISVTLNGTRLDLAAGETGSYTYTAPTGGGGGVTTYTVTVGSVSNGTVTASTTRAAKGTTVTLTVKANDGYQLSSLTVTDGSGNQVALTDKGDGKYTFTMPGSKVTVAASFTQIMPETLPFTDVAESDWFYNAVKYVYDNGLMTGTGDTAFEPNSTLTRGMMVTVLWAMAGGPVVNYAMDYTDVSQGDWYAEAVRWATSTGVANGYGEGVFAPNESITREQMAVMLYAYARYQGDDTTQGGMAIREFADYESISDWALNGLGWMVNAGLMGGKPGNLLDPTGTATRGEVAQILMNYCETVAQ